MDRNMEIDDTEKYFSELREKISNAYEFGNRARIEGKDPDQEVESVPAGDLALRVEGLVGPEGIASKIKSFGRGNIAKIIEDILGEDITSLGKEELEGRIEQAIRTSLAILTEGVVAAPIEGISRVSVMSNPDGSSYLSIYFAGPIRSAGGTAQGVTAVLGDYIRQSINLQEYRPTQDEIERYVEEIRIYNDRVSRLQYLPSDDDIREIIKNLPICINGDPTEEREVSIHRDLTRVETNRIRGGMCLVIAEGIAQKAAKVMKYAESLGLDWSFLEKISKGKVISREEEIKPLKKFMSEVVGGRPIFSSPSAKGGFRLRYGKSRSSGIAAKSIHPALQILLEGFIATGTQLKVERPGKGCIITVCDSIEGPIVKLKGGSVIRVETVEKAKEIKDNLEEIIFLGDILISYGDFLQTNTLLLPTGYCEEFWIQEVEQKIGGEDEKEKLEKISKEVPTPKEAIQISEELDVPLHPRYTYHWEDIKVRDLEKLAQWLWTGKIKNEGFILKNNDEKAKRILEFLGVPHLVRDNEILIKEYLPLLIPMGIYKDEKIKRGLFIEKIQKFKPEDSAYELIKVISPIRLRKKVGTYIGARMGRPEKARERKLNPPVHSLFPVGEAGGKERNINLAAEKGTIAVEVSRFECPKCKSLGIFIKCQKCGEHAKLRKVCPTCNYVSDEEYCPKCKTRTQYYETQDVDVNQLWKKAIAKVGSFEVKGVKGLISSYKIPEPIEKGLLRAKHKIFVFKDGTIRYDATNAPLTHFKPSEINVGVEKLNELGYGKDIYGNPLEHDDQILKLKVQDIILPEKGLSYLFQVSKFVDDELEKFYKLERFYKAEKREDLLGELVIGLAPHTSAGIIGRIIGSTKANVCFAHPFWHAAKRRNCDGDEDSILLLLDVLLNFSKKYLPEKRGGQMDAPLVISTILNPKEIDDEAHRMELVSKYPLEFYYATLERKNPTDVKVGIVQDILNNDPYSNLSFTHPTSNVTGAILESSYVKLKTMEEKVKSQLKVAEKVRAVDEREVAELIINSHFLRDAYGNLRAFSRQKFRCVKCNKSYRRIPLIGKCTKCGGKLLLTVPEGAIRKYIDISISLSEKYNVSNYLKQRLMLLKREVDSLFVNDLSKQIGLGDFM
jgi:DNA polymerase II large subunit